MGNDGVVDATLLAIAGLKRMDMDKYATAVLDWDEMLPAVAQGAIGVQCRTDGERAFLEALDGNCKTPIAGQARIIDGKIKFRGLIAMPDGSQKFTIESEGEIDDAVKIGREAGEKLKADAGDKFFEMMVEMSPQQVIGQLTK